MSIKNPFDDDLFDFEDRNATIVYKRFSRQQFIEFAKGHRVRSDTDFGIGERKEVRGFGTRVYKNGLEYRIELK